MFAYILTAALAAPAQCPGGYVAAPFAMAVTPVASLPPAVGTPFTHNGTSYVWRRQADDDYRLYSGYWLQGAYTPPTGKFWKWNGTAWAESPCPAPLPTDITAKPAAANWQTNGIDQSKISVTERATVNGSEVRTSDLVNTIGANVPDDSKHKRLTILSRDPNQRKTLADEARGVVQQLGLNDRLTVTTEDPDRWNVAGKGWTYADPATVYLTNADGGEPRHEFGAWPSRDVLAAGLQSTLLEPRPYNAAADKTIWSVSPTDPAGYLPLVLVVLVGGAIVYLMSQPAKAAAGA